MTEKPRGKGLMLFGVKEPEKRCRLAEELKKLAEAMPADLQLIHQTSELYRTISALGTLRDITTTFGYKNALRTYKRVTGDDWIEPTK